MCPVDPNFEVVSKSLKSAVDEGRTNDLKEILATVREGSGLKYQEDLLAYMKKNSAGTVEKIEKLLPQASEEVDQKTGNKYLLFSGNEDINPSRTAGRVVGAGAAEYDKLGTDMARHGLLQFTLQQAMQVNRGPITVDETVKEINKHLGLLGLDKKEHVEFRPYAKGKGEGGTLVMVDASGKVLDQVDVPWPEQHHIQQQRPIAIQA
jgi:hypothetical protein